MQLAIGIIENDRLRDPQDCARCGEFLTTNVGQLAIRLSVAAIGCGLTRREADDRGFDAAVVTDAQDSAEVTGFIVRVRGNAHQAKHAQIVADMQRTAEIVQSLAARKIVSGKGNISTRMRIRSCCLCMY